MDQNLTNIYNHSSTIIHHQTPIIKHPIIMANTNGTSAPTFKPDNSAKSISASQVFGINRLVKLLVVIEGKVISHYKHFTLSQNSGKHHRFEIVLAYDSLGNRENQNLESSHEFLGKRITVVQK